MAGFSETVDDVKSRIDLKVKRMQELENMIVNERNTLRELQSTSIDDIEALLREEQESLKVETEDLRAQIVTEREIVEQQRKVGAEIESEKKDLEQMQRNNLESYLKQASKGTPKFRDAMTDYSFEKLTADIDQIRLNGRSVVEEIAVVDRKIDNLVSKYDLNVMESSGISGKESDIAELRDTKAILIESKSRLVWSKNQNNLINKELEKKSARNKRQIDYFQSTK